MQRRIGKPTREGAVLRMFRDQLGLTAKYVAGKAHVTAQMVCLWERGKKPLSRDRLVEVLGCVDVPPEAVEAALFSQELGPPAPGLSFPTDPPREERTLIHRGSVAAGQRAAQAPRVHLLQESRQQHACSRGIEAG